MGNHTMPRYDYACPECELIQEHWHHMTEEPPIHCPRGHRMRRTIPADQRRIDDSRLLVTIMVAETDLAATAVGPNNAAEQAALAAWVGGV